MKRWGDVAVLLLVSGAVAWLALSVRRRVESWRKKRRARRAQMAERRAVEVLSRAGYRIEAAQVRMPLRVVADGETIEMSVVADYLVRGSGGLWVAEVKTGERALDLRHGPTRRQLLEYRLCFDVRGVLLVDTEGRAVRRIEFPDLSRRVEMARRRRAWALLASFLAGLGLGVWGAIAWGAGAWGALRSSFGP